MPKVANLDGHRETDRGTVYGSPEPMANPATIRKAPTHKTLAGRYPERVAGVVIWATTSTDICT